MIMCDKGDQIHQTFRKKLTLAYILFILCILLEKLDSHSRLRCYNHQKSAIKKCLIQARVLVDKFGLIYTCVGVIYTK